MSDFCDPDPAQLFVGNERLEKYLRERGLKDALEIREVVRSIDLMPLMRVHQGGGRKPIHPGILLGLVLYGLFKRITSLRELEQLAVENLGAWWVCGGIQPDHSTIGRFIIEHGDALKQLYVSCTQAIIAKLKIRAGVAAADGTTIEAATSHWKTITLEAARQAAGKPGDQACVIESADHTRREITTEAAKALAEQVSERADRRESSGAPAGKMRVSPTEPEAVFQPLKSGAPRPSYKAIVIATDRFIVGQDIHPSSETAALAPVLDQHALVVGAAPATLLLDTGFHCAETARLCCERELDVLCPAGTGRGSNGFRRARGSKLPKEAFAFDEGRDCFVCPEGAALKRSSTGTSGGGQQYITYRAPAATCRACPRRAQCSTGQRGRRICRYDGDELKQAMAQVLDHRVARRTYATRKVIVEPVFAELKHRFGLQRFRRRGLAKVKVEFALYCLAYNIKRASRLSCRLRIIFVAIRLPGAPWRMAGAALVVD